MVSISDVTRQMCLSEPKWKVKVKLLDCHAVGRVGRIHRHRDPRPGTSAGRIARGTGGIRDMPVPPGWGHGPEPQGPARDNARPGGRARCTSLRLSLGFARQTLIDPILPSQIKIACSPMPYPK